MKKLLFILIALSLFLACRTEPKLAPIKGTYSVFCQTDTSLVLPMWTPKDGGSKANFEVHLQFNQDGVYLRSKELLRLAQINLHFSEEIVNPNSIYGITDRNNVRLEFLDKNKDNTYLYFAPYSKFVSGYANLVDEIIVMYYADSKFGTDAYAEDRVTFSKDEFHKYMELFKAHLQ